MSRVRTFVAIEIEPGVRRRAQQQIQLLEAIKANVKWVDPANIHLTLKFLGDVEDIELPRVCQVATQAAAEVPPFVVTCRGLGAFPDLDRPRTIWMGLDDPSGHLSRLQANLESAYGQLGFPVEKRHFVPHLTLGRVSQPSRLLREVSRVLEENADSEWGSFPVEQVVVFSSQLTRQGAQHTALSHIELGPDV